MENDAAYEAFSAAVEADPYFAVLRPELEKYLKANSIPLSPNHAQNVWSAHLLLSLIHI